MHRPGAPHGAPVVSVTFISADNPQAAAGAPASAAFGAAPRAPVSATLGWTALAGFAAYIASLAVLALYRPFADDAVSGAMFVIAVTTTAIFAVDLAWYRVWRRPTTGLDFRPSSASLSRTAVKYLGLLASAALAGIAYWLFPEYRDPKYAPYFDLLRRTVAPWLLLAIPYFYLVDGRMREPRDGYWHLGMAVLLKWDKVDRAVLVQHLLGWTIKGFFLALMVSFLCNDLRWLSLVDFGAMSSFSPLYEFLYRGIFLVDVGLATLGYVMAFRVTDTHLRSSEPTMLGWLVAIVCYDPFWTVIDRSYLPYGTGHPWGVWLAARPALYAVWGSGILILSGIYVWATVAFGARFSNLTHRGIITSGPYRFTKHPAYIAKNLSWWMISVPFLPRGTLGDTIARCAMLALVNLIYFMRARTEEWHLSRDPTYVTYAVWMEHHGLLRFIRRIPVLRHAGYRSPESAVTT